MLRRPRPEAESGSGRRRRQMRAGCARLSPWRVFIVLYVMNAAMHLAAIFWFFFDWRQLGIAVLLHGAALAWFVFLDVRNNRRQDRSRDGPGSGGLGGR